MIQNDPLYSISIYDSIDMNYQIIDNEIKVIPNEITKKCELWTAVFTNYQLIGWYTFGEIPSNIYFKIHHQLSIYIKDPIFLLFNQTLAMLDSYESETLPLKVYHVDNIQIVANDIINAINNVSDSCELFIDISFEVETSDVEKVALDHITKSIPVPGKTSLEVQNQSLITSLKILDNKVEFMINTLYSMKNDSNKEVNDELLRNIAKICQSLPPIDTTMLQNDYEHQITNTLMISYLSAVTKTTNQLNELNETYISLYSEKGYNKK